MIEILHKKGEKMLLELEETDILPLRHAIDLEIQRLDLEIRCRGFESSKEPLQILCRIRRVLQGYKWENPYNPIFKQRLKNGELDFGDGGEG